MKFPRQSNIELLRCIAMFMILALHADYLLMGVPTTEDFHNSFWSANTRNFIEYLTIGGVNIFIIISGWFMIKPKLRSFAALIFQIAFFLVGLGLVTKFLGFNNCSVKELLWDFMCFGEKTHWFIKSYIALYILAPVLNLFIEHASKTLYRNTLIVFFAFQTVYGWTGWAEFTVMGWSVYSFIGLYLGAQYVRRYLVDNEKISALSGGNVRYIYYLCIDQHQCR